MAALLRAALCLALLAAPVALAGCPFAGLVGSDSRRELMAMGGSAPAPCNVELLNTRNERNMLRSIPWQTQTAHAVKRVRRGVCSLAAGAQTRAPASTERPPPLARAALHHASMTTPTGVPLVARLTRPFTASVLRCAGCLGCYFLRR